MHGTVHTSVNAKRRAPKGPRVVLPSAESVTRAALELFFMLTSSELRGSRAHPRARSLLTCQSQVAIGYRLSSRLFYGLFVLGHVFSGAIVLDFVLLVHIADVLLHDEQIRFV